MRDTLRRLAASGRTVFISSHILGEVRQLAEVVGIIARGKLVREGPMDELLASQGTVRVRVEPGDVERALAITDGLAGSGATTPMADAGPGWISVQFDPDRSADVNRALAQAGIFAARIEAGADLEALFLELTGEPATASPELAGSPVQPPAAPPTAPTAPASGEAP